jgi:hypothetical protein
MRDSGGGEARIEAVRHSMGGGATVIHDDKKKREIARLMRQVEISLFLWCDVLLDDKMSKFR